MASPEQSTCQENPVAHFSNFAIEQANRLRDLSVFYTHAAEVVSDHNQVNELLVEAGRPDLAITEQAAMDQYNTVDKVRLNTNNFAPNFTFYTGRHETGEKDWEDQPITEPTPATEGEILALKDLPTFDTHDERVALIETGKFPALRTDSISHAGRGRPAFLRMLVLFPDFTKELVIGMSAIPRPSAGSLEPEIFIAYQLMSQLVDASDTYVRGDDGTIDNWHLCR